MRFLFVCGVFSMLTACSSADAPTTGGTDAGSDTATAADTGTATETSTTTDTGTAAADTAPEDITMSKECKALCDAVKAACPSATCDPKFDCAVKSPHCVASTKPVLDCKAKTGSISCGSSGFSIVHSCKYDDSVCG